MAFNHLGGSGLLKPNECLLVGVPGLDCDNDDDPLLDLSDHSLTEGSTGNNRIPIQSAVNVLDQTTCGVRNSPASSQTTQQSSGGDGIGGPFRQRSSRYEDQCLLNEIEGDLLGSGDPTFLSTDLQAVNSARMPIEASQNRTPHFSEDIVCSSASKDSLIDAFGNVSGPVSNGDLLHDHQNFTSCVSSEVPAVTVHTSGPGFENDGHVIDYTDKTEDNGRGRSRRDPVYNSLLARMGESRDVVLSSFPPPARSRGGGDGAVIPRNEHEVEGLHCHYGISRRIMSDKLARRQLLAVLILCILFMVGETVGELAQVLYILH